MIQKTNDMPARKLAVHDKARLPLSYKDIPKPLLESAILVELAAEVPGRITKVRSCSDCCMECNPDGTPNEVGKAFQKKYTRTVSNIHGSYSWLDCAHCPIHLNLTDDEWEEILAEIDESE